MVFQDEGDAWIRAAKYELVCAMSLAGRQIWKAIVHLP
jgi:hypothetical protein